MNQNCLAEKKFISESCHFQNAFQHLLLSKECYSMFIIGAELGLIYKFEMC